MIEAKLKITEVESGKVEVELTAPPFDDTETDAETLMLVTFMALNNCLSQSKYLKPLGDILGPEITMILEGYDNDD